MNGMKENEIECNHIEQFHLSPHEKCYNCLHKSSLFCILHAKISHPVALPTSRQQVVFGKLLTTCNNLVDIISLVPRLLQQLGTSSANTTCWQHVNRLVTTYVCILFCSVLFCSVLFCSVLFCSVLFCSVLFCSVLFCSVLFCSVLFCSVLFCSVLFCSVLFCSVQN